MTITVNNIKALHTQDVEVTQTGSKQLFCATLLSGLKLFYSYKTIIGFSLNGTKLYLTEEKYSRTTSSHCTLLSRQYPKTTLLVLANFDKQLKELGYAN